MDIFSLPFLSQYPEITTLFWSQAGILRLSVQRSCRGSDQK
jgi:hypothetical protein